MATYSKVFLSGSTNGKNIKVTETSSPGTTIHTCPAGETSKDEIWLWAVNSDTSDRKLTIEWGGTSAPDDLIEMTIPAEGGRILIVAGECLNNGLVVKAFAASANVVLISGYVNRITD